MSSTHGKSSTRKLPEGIYDEGNGLSYTLVGEYYLPNLEAPTTGSCDIGTWGRRRRDFLKNHRKAAYAIMKTEGTLIGHLCETNAEAESMFADLVSKMAKARGIDEGMKHTDQMGWVAAMNNVRAAATEAINTDIIYV